MIWIWIQVSKISLQVSQAVPKTILSVFKVSISNKPTLNIQRGTINSENKNKKPRIERWRCIGVLYYLWSKRRQDVGVVESFE